jgi:uncharacterized protein YndB with AHSA1/START domain
MTEPHVPHRLELELVVPGSPDQVWDAIATAEGISSWMVPTDLDAHEGGKVVFHMGPEDASHGRVTAFEPTRRIEFEEHWEILTGHTDAIVTPLVTEFVVEARSGGTCVVRVVTSAFGVGADWENEFFEEMARGWAAMLDNLRIYLAHFPGRHATPLWVSVNDFPAPPEETAQALARALGVGAPGDPVTAFGNTGRVERVIANHFLLRLDEPMAGLVSVYTMGLEEGSGVHMQAYLFSEGAEDYVRREQPTWQSWLEGVARAHANPPPATQ